MGPAALKAQTLEEHADRGSLAGAVLFNLTTTVSKTESETARRAPRGWEPHPVFKDGFLEMHDW